MKKAGQPQRVEDDKFAKASQVPSGECLKKNNVASHDEEEVLFQFDLKQEDILIGGTLTAVPQCRITNQLSLSKLEGGNIS